MEKIVIISKIDYDAINLTKNLTENGQKLKIILLCDAVFLLENKKYLDEMQLEKKIKFYALEEDINKRGIKNSLINIINYDEMVDILMEPNNSLINL